MQQVGLTVGKAQRRRSILFWQFFQVLSFIQRAFHPFAASGEPIGSRDDVKVDGKRYFAVHEMQ